MARLYHQERLRKGNGRSISGARESGEIGTTPDHYKLSTVKANTDLVLLPAGSLKTLLLFWPALHKKLVMCYTPVLLYQDYRELDLFKNARIVLTTCSLTFVSHRTNTSVSSVAQVTTGDVCTGKANWSDTTGKATRAVTVTKTSRHTLYVCRVAMYMWLSTQTC